MYFQCFIDQHVILHPQIFISPNPASTQNIKNKMSKPQDSNLLPNPNSDVPSTTCLSASSLSLLQPKSTTSTTNTSTSELKENYRNWIIVFLLILIGVLAVFLSAAIKFIQVQRLTNKFKSTGNRYIEDCVMSRTEFTGWQFREICERCESKYLEYEGSCIRFES